MMAVWPDIANSGTESGSIDNLTNWTWLENNFNNGIVNLSIQHTSASLIVQENADPDVQTDLINYFDEGDLMIKRCYNIGIKLVKQINVKTAFKALKDKNLQQEIYTHILEKVREKAIRTIEESKISKKL